MPDRDSTMNTEPAAEAAPADETVAAPAAAPPPPTPTAAAAAAAATSSDTQTETATVDAAPPASTETNAVAETAANATTSAAAIDKAETVEVVVVSAAAVSNNTATSADATDNAVAAVTPIAAVEPVPTVVEVTPPPEEKPKTSQKSPLRPDTPKTPAPLVMGCMNGFNTEEFLARVNMNEKINNILRSPTKTANGVRQRSVFTTITPSSSRFNASAAPFVSQRAAGSSAMAHAVLGGGMGMGMAPKDASTPSSAMGGSVMGGGPVIAGSLAAASRQMSIPVNIGTGVSPHHYAGYESPLTGRSAGMARGIFSTRYPVAPPPSPIYGFESEMCRMPPTMSPSHHAQQFPQPMPPPPFAVGRLSNSHRGGEYENPTPPPCPGAGPIAMTNGTIQLRLRDGIRIDMTLDKAVRVLNQRSMVAIALSRNCSNSALIHPNGRVLQSGSKVEIVTYDGMKTNNYVRYAKMWYKGVSFTSESCALIYLVDTAGTRTTTDTFTDLTKDYTLTVFYDDSRHGPSYVQDANEVIQNSMYSCTDEGTEIYEINGFRITQAADGLVKLTRTHNKCLIRTSPGNGSATLTTPGIHCTASLGKTSHLFVRRNEKRMHFDGSCFIVRNAGHSAGFNENNLLIVY